MLIPAFFIGVVLALQLAELPHISWLALLPSLIILVFFFPKQRAIFALPIGFLWVVFHASIILTSYLPADLQGNDVIIEGRISQLPEKFDKRIRIQIDVDQLYVDEVKQTHYPSRIRINWYGKVPNVKADEKWKLQVRLKPVNSLQNPGGFDYEKWLFENKIRAIGYVKKSDINRRIAPARTFSVNRYRNELQQQIISLTENSQFRGIILALALGDRSEIGDTQWQVLTATGTNHLVAISGLHIGLVAAAVFFLSRRLFRLTPKLLLYVPAHKLAAIFALAAAFFYALLAGFAIPTQRALIMTAVIMVSIILNRNQRVTSILMIALMAVLLIDPFSVLSMGFWLSFLAVGAILFGMQSRINVNSWWWKWGRVQWLVSIALAPVLLFSFQTISIVSPIANIVAVPWVSLLVVPLVLLSVVLLSINIFSHSILLVLTEFLLQVSDKFLAWLWLFLDYLTSIPFAQWSQFSPVEWTLIPATIGVLLLLAPKGFPAKLTAVFFLLPMFIIRPSGPEKNQFWFSLLDVGQGLSAVVQTKNHTLVFDTGPRFGSGFDTGKAVVIPFLKKNAVDTIDMLIISHADNDHIGGMKSILAEYPVKILLSGAMYKTKFDNAKQCIAGQNWFWDGVYFEIINPDSTNLSPRNRRKGNNAACVLRISAGDNAVLITADIEKTSENNLLQNNATKLNAKIMTVPHHGSKTSSGAEFIRAVNPELVLYPVGFANRYNLPSDKIVKRYQAFGAKGFQTSHFGAITLIISTNKISQPKLFRVENKRFWHRKINFKDVSEK